MNKDGKYTAYCGLYCGDCIPFNQKLFDAAERLKEQLEQRKFDEYARLKSKKNEVFSNYEVFVKVLSGLIELRCTKTCVNNGGKPDCSIRNCVRKKGIKGCWQCSGFEICELLEQLSAYHGDTPQNNLQLIKEYGVENWADKRGRHYVWNNTK